MSGISIHLSIKIRILSLKSISFAMSNASCAWILLLSLFKDFFAKTLNDVRLDMGGKVFTTVKSILSNRCDTIWNIYVYEGVAIAKSKLSNSCDTIWDIYAGERVAECKSRISNCCDTIWNVYVYEGFATQKGLLSNRWDTIWDIYVSEGFTPHKSRISNRCDTIWNVYVIEGFAPPIQRQISCNNQNDKKLRVNANIYSI